MVYVVYTVLSLAPECILSLLYLLCWEMVCILGKKMVVTRMPAMVTMATATEGSCREGGAK